MEIKTGLLVLQCTYVAIFATLTILFGIEAFASSKPEECIIKIWHLDGPPTLYNTTERFEFIFYAGFVTYLMDFMARSVVVFGLFFNNFKLQLGGVFATITVSTTAQTALIIMIPVFRWNYAGI